MRTELLRLSAIRLAFSSHAILNGVNFEVPKGAIVSLIGPNGAGKTSLFNCITGFYKPRSGTIRFEGHDLLKLKPHRVTQAGVARTFQNLRLFRDMSVLENVMSGMHCRTHSGALAAIFQPRSQRDEEKEIRAFSVECLRFVGVTADWNRIATTLPYGHQRRVEMARALATRPKLLLLDEPAAGLHSGEKQELITLINRIRDELGISVLLIEHDTGFVMKVSGRISVLDHGVMIAEGTAKEIRTNPKVIEAYLGEEDAEANLDR
jgi:branched-chain amino acid transport system ATP-binding protein